MDTLHEWLADKSYWYRAIGTEMKTAEIDT